jgi:hypothetical protein
MSVKLDSRVRTSGTRFKVYPQSPLIEAFKEPETIHIDIAPGNIKHGPSDDKFFIIDAINKLPYSEINRPPYTQQSNAPVVAGSDGHFDHLEAATREFNCAATYASVRRVYDIWQDYFRDPIVWYFESDFKRLEIIPIVEAMGAWSGYGFMEFGFEPNLAGNIDPERPYCRNFDVLAHEFGHALITSVMGSPSESENQNTVDYNAMHESSGDLVAIISVLHFDSVVDHLLHHTKGNLFGKNELSRVGELKNSNEIRLAFNDLKMSNVGSEPHNRSQPLTGGVFDILVEVFQKLLVERGLISQTLADASTQGVTSDGKKIKADFRKAYRDREAAFHEALLDARDYIGELLARTWSRLSPDFLTFGTIAKGLMRADKEMGGSHQQTVRECLEWREINVPKESKSTHSWSLDTCGFTKAKKRKRY